MSIPVTIRFGSTEIEEMFRDGFMDDNYSGDARDYLPDIITEYLEEEGHTPDSYEWRYTLASPEEWFSVTIA